jgi:hypothetical protein
LQSAFVFVTGEGLAAVLCPMVGCFEKSAFLLLAEHSLAHARAVALRLLAGAGDSSARVLGQLGLDHGRAAGFSVSRRYLAFLSRYLLKRPSVLSL